MNIFKNTLLIFPFIFLQSGNVIASPDTNFVTSVQQQRYTIKGVIVDVSGEPIIGANIKIKNSSLGVITDINGQFSLEVSSQDVLVVSYIGFKTVEVKVGSRDILKVVLKEDSQALDEVVVVGYGVQTKKSVVGAISQTDSEELMKSGGVTSVNEALQGKLPGVTASYTSGRPGEKDSQLFIRGQSSWNGGGQPLVLIDGVEGSIGDVDINEIENISVLKDASATAVYGVKGANGVILLTTKRGQEGKAKLSLSANLTMKMVSKIPEQFDAYDAASLANRTILQELAYQEAAWKDYMPEAIMEKYRNQTSQYQREAFPNINWADYLLRDVAMDQQVNFSVRGGSKKVRYFCNISYLHEGDLFKNFENQKGYDGGFNYHRFNYRSNLDFSITNTTQLGINVSGSYGTSRSPSAKEEVFLYSGLYSLGPMAFYPVFEDGSYGFDPMNDTFEMRNPVADFVSGGTTTQNRLSLVLDFVLDQKLDFITKGLSVKGHFAMNNVILSNQDINDGGVSNQFVRKAYVNDGKDIIIGLPTNYDSDYAFIPLPWTLSNYTMKDWARVRRMIYDLSLNYSRSFDEHNISALALFKREQYTMGSMFPAYREDWVGRVTYNYAYKYFFEANGAYNGSEKFGPGYRFDLFPSVALGWMISEEKFMKNIKWLDKLKVRASYGLVGDDNFSGRWKYITQWGSYKKSIEMNKFSVDNTRFSPYNLYKEMSLGNKDLHWEKAIKSDIGVELAVLNNQIKVDFDYFSEERSDILITGAQRAVPSWFGTTPPDANLGKVKVHGYELVINGNKKIGDWLLNSRVTYSHAVDEILVKDDPQLKPDYQKAAGYPIGQIHTQIPGNIMENWDDVYMSTELSNGQEGKRIGYYDVIDFNCDGNINDSYDTVPWGYPNRPQNTWTFDLGANYKGLGFSVQFYGQNNCMRVASFEGHRSNQRMYFTDRSDFWTPENPDGTDTFTPWSLQKAANNPLKNIYDGSMLRLKMAEIYYNIPEKWCKKLNIQRLRVFINGYNLFLWSELPDDRDYGNGETSFRGAYPNMRRINMGFNLDF